MESLDTAACFMDDLLDFASDIGEKDDDEDKPKDVVPPPSSSSIQFKPDDPRRSLPECAEEELEWLSNKDAFPAVETFVGILAVNPGSSSNIPKQRSPVSVLENSNSTSSSNSTNSGTIMSCCGSLAAPVHRRARSKRRRKRRRGFPDVQTQRWWWCIQANNKNAKETMTTTIGRKCQHCQAEKTPQWRAGPLGPKTLCNACGVRYKSGRLVPEYRPASSPTFSSKLHSNSHRKIVEMRKGKQSNMVVKPVDKW